MANFRFFSAFCIGVHSVSGRKNQRIGVGVGEVGSSVDCFTFVWISSTQNPFL